MKNKKKDQENINKAKPVIFYVSEEEFNYNMAQFSKEAGFDIIKDIKRKEEAALRKAESDFDDVLIRVLGKLGMLDHDLDDEGNLISNCCEAIIDEDRICSKCKKPA